MSPALSPASLSRLDDLTSVFARPLWLREDYAQSAEQASRPVPSGPSHSKSLWGPRDEAQRVFS